MHVSGEMIAFSQTKSPQNKKHFSVVSFRSSDSAYHHRRAMAGSIHVTAISLLLMLMFLSPCLGITDAPFVVVQKESLPQPTQVRH
ncbi:hypothetical protein SAY86_030178 [Trapa natans]|uniref:Transmembrane protein n=1 Tax=Trapa natans TaxID=22666 RepID=A0AAN7RCL0_TRANT|nr:hypothetical protein SAY86_030178 [Trapa natans]